jgi:6-phosphogluconolactonase
MTGTPDELAAAFARRFLLLASPSERGDRLSLAIPGGSVAEAFLPALRSRPPDWSRLSVWWVDERAVSPEDPQSNYGLARRLWLGPVQAPSTAVHRMPADAPDLFEAAATYERQLLAVLGSPPAFDFVLLGVGADGHIASLFPGHPALDERRRVVAALTDAPKPPPRRLTLTLPVLAAAKTVIVAAFGAEKAQAIRDARSGTADTPLARLLRAAPHTELWTDHGVKS